MGKLFIAWGPGIDRDLDPHFSDRFTDHWAEGISMYLDFHASAINNDSDPFASRYFGDIVKTLTSGQKVVVMDRTFDDPKRRRLVERAFQRAFPDLIIEQVKVGGEPELGGLDEVMKGIVIEDDVYAEIATGSNEYVVVESDASNDVLVAALAKAAERMMSVGEDGREYDAEALSRGDIDIYTPNSVSDVSVDENGNPGFYVDCKGAMERPMASRFRQILLQELEQHGVASALVRVPD